MRVHSSVYDATLLVLLATTLPIIAQNAWLPCSYMKGNAWLDVRWATMPI
jgi:hypothetical protein